MESDFRLDDRDAIDMDVVQYKPMYGFYECRWNAILKRNDRK